MHASAGGAQAPVAPNEPQPEGLAPPMGLMPVPVEADVDHGLSVYPTAEQYSRWGLSARGARHVHKLFGAPEDTTTAAICHMFIKTRTTPTGWEHHASPLVEAGRQRYKHEYVDAVTGQAQSAAPPETCSLCELLAAEPETTGLAARPTAFLSHAWKFSFSQLVEALEAFQAAQPEGEPEIFFWIDVCSIDQHNVGGWPQIWWSTTFKEVIKQIGHTVMMLSPWQNPHTLTRAWCLWELYCTVETGSEFSVCLGMAEQATFEAVLFGSESGWRNIFEAFSGIDVSKAQAGSPADLAMIIGAASNVEGGLRGLNNTAIKQMRQWFLGELRRLAWSRVESGSVAGGGQAASAVLCATTALCELIDDHGRTTGVLDEADELIELAAAGFRATDDAFGVDAANCNIADVLCARGKHATAWPIFEASVAFWTRHRGSTHEKTLHVRQRLGTCMTAAGDNHGAMVELQAAAQGLGKKLGPGHEWTLRACEGLATVHYNMGDNAAAVVASRLVVAGMLEARGERNVDTLRAQMLLAECLLTEGWVEEAVELLEFAASEFAAQLGVTSFWAFHAQEQLEMAREWMEQSNESEDEQSESESEQEPEQVQEQEPEPEPETE